MSHLSHDTSARLLGLTPGELESLVKTGEVRRIDRNAYALATLVQDYIGHLKGSIEKRELSPKQAEIADHLDLSERAVRDLLDDLGINHKLSTLTEIRVAYIRHLREVAAGRMAAGDLDLAAERAALARAQRERIEMQNAVSRKELAPVVAIEQVLAQAGSKVAAVLDTIPGMIRRRVPGLSAADIELVAAEVAKARNIAAAIRMADLDDEPEEAEALAADAAQAEVDA